MSSFTSLPRSVFHNVVLRLPLRETLLLSAVSTSMRKAIHDKSLWATVTLPPRPDITAGLLEALCTLSGSSMQKLVSPDACDDMRVYGGLVVTPALAPFDALLKLVQANAASLREVHVVCSDSPLGGFPYSLDYEKARALAEAAPSALLFLDVLCRAEAAHGLLVGEAPFERLRVRRIPITFPTKEEEEEELEEEEAEDEEEEEEDEQRTHGQDVDGTGAQGGGQDAAAEEPLANEAQPARAFPPFSVDSVVRDARAHPSLRELHLNHAPLSEAASFEAVIRATVDGRLSSLNLFAGALPDDAMAGLSQVVAGGSLAHLCVAFSDYGGAVRCSVVPTPTFCDGASSSRALARLDLINTDFWGWRRDKGLRDVTKRDGVDARAAPRGRRPR